MDELPLQPVQPFNQWSIKRQKEWNKKFESFDIANFINKILEPPNEEDEIGEDMYSGVDQSIDKYMLILDMLKVSLPGWEASFGYPKKDLAILEEFRNMQLARFTITSAAESCSQMAGEYLSHHYAGAQKPLWYANLTN